MNEVTFTYRSGTRTRNNSVHTNLHGSQVVNLLVQFKPFVELAKNTSGSMKVRLELKNVWFELEKEVE